MNPASLSRVRDSIDIFHGPPLQVVSECLRGFIAAAPGHSLIAIDFSSVEGRGLAWLSGEERKLVIYRTHGKVYEQAASDIYRIPMEAVTNDQRQIGKVAELALGYQGGKGAFVVMAKTYGVKVKEADAEKIKTAWREKNQKIVAYWAALNNAAKDAIFAPGVKFVAGAPGRQVTFLKKGSFLWCRLPSGRALCYPYPRVEMVEAPWTKENGELVQSVTYMSEDSATRQWARHKAYGGLFAENITQAVCRDLLANAMVRLDAAGFSVVCHVHDEVIVEVPQSSTTTAEEIARIACELPAWAKDLPLAASGWRGKRYKK